MYTLDEVLSDVKDERIRQDIKWDGAKNIVHRSRLDAIAVLMEEVGEVANAHLENDPRSYYDELIQVAAVAVAAAQSAHRKPIA